MGKMAEAMLKMRTTQTAIELLDQICEPWRGCDAEFESEDTNAPGRTHPDYTHYSDPTGPIGVLITEAFGEAGRDYSDGWPDDAAVDAWWDGPRRLFRERYAFC